MSSGPIELFKGLFWKLNGVENGWWEIHPLQTYLYKMTVDSKVMENKAAESRCKFPKPALRTGTLWSMFTVIQTIIALPIRASNCPYSQYICLEQSGTSRSEQWNTVWCHKKLIYQLVVKVTDDWNMGFSVESETAWSHTPKLSLCCRYWAKFLGWCVWRWLEVEDPIRNRCPCPCLLCSYPSRHIQPGDEVWLETWQTCRKLDLLSPLGCSSTGIQI